MERPFPPLPFPDTVEPTDAPLIKILANEKSLYRCTSQVFRPDRCALSFSFPDFESRSNAI